MGSSQQGFDPRWQCPPISARSSEQTATSNETILTWPALKMTTTLIDFMNRNDDAKSIYTPAGLPMSIRLERDGRNGKWCVVLIARFRQKLKPYYNLSNIGGWSAINSLISFDAQHMPRISIPKKKKRLPYTNDPKNVYCRPTQYPPLLCRLGLLVVTARINKNISFSVPSRRVLHFFFLLHTLLS